MNKINVLVLGVGGNVSQGILKAIALSNIKCNIVGACVSPDSLGLYMCNKAYISPFANSDEFIPWLLDICKKEKINIILSGVEENIIAIAKNTKIIELETNAIFISSDIKHLMIGQDKFLTCEWLKANKCNYPLYCLAEDSKEVIKITEKVGFPLIAKPRRGKGSQGIIMINDLQDLSYVTKLDDYIIQEYIGDELSEYTVGCYCDKYGKLINTIIMQRELQHGTTYKATVVENNSIKIEVEKICGKFKAIGPFNIQLRMDKNGQPTCFELNVRFSGTTPMRAHFGYNDVAAMIKEYILEIDIANELKAIKGTAYRYTNEIYFYDNVKEVMSKEGFINNLSDYNVLLDSFGGYK